MPFPELLETPLLLDEAFSDTLAEYLVLFLALLNTLPTSSADTSPSKLASNCELSVPAFSSSFCSSGFSISNK